MNAISLMEYGYRHALETMGEAVDLTVVEELGTHFAIHLEFLFSFEFALAIDQLDDIVGTFIISLSDNQQWRRHMTE